ncbi:hypothetical protein FQN54_009278 [Arachnomyces sp. PD_36]|nr:hypothetical protein FQN54_009278 [Arachnomyces sp. PD_36]
MSTATSREDQELLRLFSHSRKWLGSYMIYREPRILPRQYFTTLPSRSFTNSLRKLPPELLFLIYSYLDLESITKLRTVDRWMKVMIDAFPAYQNLLQHAPMAVQALADTHLLASFSISALYDALRSEACVGCSDFGPFLLLPLGKRCCFNCLQHNLLLRVITVPAAQKCFGLNKSAVDSLPKLHSLPGTYGPESRLVKGRKQLVSVWEAQERGIELHGGRDEMETTVLTNSLKELAAFTRKTEKWSSRSANSLASRRPVRPKTPKEILEAPNDPFRLLASVPFPFLRRGGTVEHGMSCVGCQNLKANHALANKTLDTRNLTFERELEQNDIKSYTERGILQHFSQCRGTKNVRSLKRKR